MSRREGQRGQTLPMVAVALVVLMGAVGFSVDVGYHQYQQRMQQTATDSAALAAAKELGFSDYAAAGQHDASINGYTDNTGGGACSSTVGTVCVNIVSPPVSPDAFAGNSNAVEATITENHATFFENVFGVTSVPVTTKAVALLVNQASNLCVAALDINHTANFNGTAGGGSLTATNCGLQFNGGANFNNATVNAASINCAPTASSCSNGTFTGASPVSAAPIGDPCPAITYCAHLISNPPPCSSVSAAPTPDATGSVTVPSGCYNGWTYHNSQGQPNLTVNLCGLYELTGNANISSTGSNAPPITIQITPSCPGVTFYITGGGQVTFKNSNMNLSAPTSGDYSEWSAGEQNVLFYQTTDDTNTAVLQSATCTTGCSSTINGMMYFPSANLNYTKQPSSTSGNGTLIIAYDLNCNGCEAGVFESPSYQGPTLRVAVLGE